MRIDMKIMNKCEKALENIKLMVNSQARDEGLWFIPETAPEDYLQNELRKLHGLIEHESDPD